MKNNIDTLILSDLHLASIVCQCKKIIEILDKYKYKRLIINGDAFDSSNFERLKSSHFEILKKINKMTSPKKNVEVIWIKGNHDERLFYIVSHLVGMEVYDDYNLEVNSQKYYIIHGHIFDSFIMNRPWLTKIFSDIYYLIQKIDGEKQTISRFVKNKSKNWKKLGDTIGVRAVRYLKHKFEKNWKDYTIICGHTHVACDKVIEDVRYMNSGCWTDIPCSYIVIEHSGVAKLKFFE